MRKQTRSNDAFLLKLEQRILEGVRPADPIVLQNPGMTPETAVASYARQMLYHSETYKAKAKYFR